MNYGYARCSTNESKQDIFRQVKELKEVHCKDCFTNIFTLLDFRAIIPPTDTRG